MSTLFIRCQDKSNVHCKPQEYSYLTITDEAKSKVPYLKPSFDTLSYANNKGDTLVFVRQPKDSSWYCTPSYPNTDCLPDYYCYENYGAKYNCIKGNGSFEFKHGKSLFIDFINHSRPSDVYSDMIEIFFNNFHFIVEDNDVDRKNVSTYNEVLIFKKDTFYKSFYSYYEFSDSVRGKGYYNKDFGLFHLEDKVNNNAWTLLKK